MVNMIAIDDIVRQVNGEREKEKGKSEGTGGNGKEQSG